MRATVAGVLAVIIIALAAPVLVVLFIPELCAAIAVFTVLYLLGAHPLIAVLCGIAAIAPLARFSFWLWGRPGKAWGGKAYKGGN